jgi:hypothetical protein
MIPGSSSFATANAAKRMWKRAARLKRVKYVWRRRLSDRSPAWARKLLGSAACYIDMLFLDHGVFRLLYANQHRLGQRAWRSGQPAPHQIGALARQGLRTIVNLRASGSAAATSWRRAPARGGG